MTASVIEERRETILLEKRARMRRRSLVGSLIFHSMTRGVTIKRVSAVKSVARKEARSWLLWALKQVLRLRFRCCHPPSQLGLHMKVKRRRRAV